MYLLLSIALSYLPPPTPPFHYISLLTSSCSSILLNFLTYLLLFITFIFLLTSSYFFCSLHLLTYLFYSFFPLYLLTYPLLLLHSIKYSHLPPPTSPFHYIFLTYLLLILWSPSFHYVFSLTPSCFLFRYT